MFQLLVELTFSNGMEEETQLFRSPSFLMRSKPRQKKRKLSGKCQQDNKIVQSNERVDPVPLVWSTNFCHGEKKGMMLTAANFITSHLNK